MTADVPDGSTSRDLRDAEIISLLAAGATQKEAAQGAGCSERTVRRLLEDREFQSRVHVARRNRLEEANARVPNLVAEALDTLAELMRSSEADTVRLGAARMLLTQSARLEAEELADRVHRLEEEVSGTTGWVPDPVPVEGEDGDITA